MDQALQVVGAIMILAGFAAAQFRLVTQESYRCGASSRGRASFGVWPRTDGPARG